MDAPWPTPEEYAAEQRRVLLEKFARDPTVQAAIRAELERREPALVARYRERMRRAEWGE